MGPLSHAERIAHILQIYGGWGMCAILIVGIVALYWSMSRVISQQSEQLRALLIETATVLAQARDTNREVAETNRNTNQALEKVSPQLTILEGLQRNR